jgi:aquaporin Z
MEATEIAVLMLSTDICGTLIYADESPIKSLDLTPELKSVLMGTAIAITTFLIIRSPFGRRSGAHFNPAVTLTFFGSNVYIGGTLSVASLFSSSARLRVCW